MFPYLFRFLTAKVFQDRGEELGWDLSSPLALYKKADRHLRAKIQRDIPAEFFEDGLLTTVWQEFMGGLHFENISAADLAYIYESCFIDDDTRSKLSIHSTPFELADYIVGNLPFEQLPEDGRKVLEPFCGSGVFLAAAMRRLGDLTALDFYDSQARHEYFKERLVGIESEPLALEVCRLRLTLSDYPNGNGWSLYRKDVFTWSQWEPELRTTDVLLANPPFHSLRNDERLLYGAKKAVAPAEMLRRILEQPPALMGVVLPPSFLTGPDYRDANRGLAGAYRKVEYVELPANVFVHAKRDTVAVLCSERRSDFTTSLRTQTVAVSAKRVNRHFLGSFYQQGAVSWETVQSKVVPLPGQAFSLRVDPPDDIWELLRTSHILRDVADIHLGIHWKKRDDGKSKTAPRTDVVSPILLWGFHLGYEKMKGWLKQFSIGMPTYLSLRESHQHPADKAWKHRWSEQKVVCNRGRFQLDSPWRLAGYADEKGMAFTQAYMAIWPQAGVGIYALAGVLCSPLANAFMIDRDKGADNRIATLSTLPLPPRAALSPNGIIEGLSRRVHEMFERVAEYTWSKPAPQELDEALMRLDAAVMEAYELPPEVERKLLDRFAEAIRPVVGEAWAGRQYFKKGFTESISLSDYIAITLDWQKTNRRRMALITKDYLESLSEAETAELERLQLLAKHLITLEGMYSSNKADSLIARLKQSGHWSVE